MLSLLATKERWIVVAKGYSVEDLEVATGDKAAYALGYKAVGVAGWSLALPDYVNLKDLEVPIFDPSLGDKQIFQGILDYTSDFKYVVDQADPHSLWTEGGNCQAVTLFLQKAFNENGIKTKLVLDNGISHMYLMAKIGDQVFDVDLVEKKVALREGGIVDGKSFD